MIKRFISVILLCAVLVLSACMGLFGCSGGGTADNSEAVDVGTDAGNDHDAEGDSNTDGANNSESGDNKPVLGVWWWSDSLGDEYLDFANDNGVTEIYYCSGKFNDSVDGFIERANSRGMSVYWLAGEYQWIENNASVIKQIDRFVTYQQTYAHKYAGIHFDIEPHQHKEFKTRRTELITAFVELTATLKSRYPNIYIEYDLPFWLEDEITVGSDTRPAFQFVMDNASRVTLMSYRDTAQKIYSVSSAEIEYAKSTGKRLNLGVETKSTEGNQVSFQEEGKQVMYGEIAKLRDMIPADFGVVIHQIKHWYDLKD